MLKFGGGRGVWGLDVGESALKAVKMAKQGGNLVVQDFQIIPYSELETSGSKRREDLVFQALMQFFTPQDRQGVSFVASIPSQNVFSRFIGLPPVDRRRVPEIVRYEARQQIPFDLSEVIWDYQLVRPDFMPGEEIEIGLFAVKRDVINTFLNQFVMAQDWLQGVQIAPLAVYNFLRTDAQTEKPTVVIDIGAQSTDLLIVEDSKFWLRNLPIAGNSFNAILEKKFNISSEEAEKVKLGLGHSKHRSRVFEVLRPVFKDLVSEIQRSIGYYKSLAREVKFDEVLLLGEGHKLYGLHRFLSDQLQYRIRPLTELKSIQSQVKERQEEFQEHLPGLSVALGLAVQGCKEGDATVDLLPEEFTLRRELKRKRVPAAVAVGLLWAAMLLLFVGHKLAIANVQVDEFQRTVTTEEGERVRQVIGPADIKAVLDQADEFARRNREARAEINTSVIDQFRPLGRLRDYWSQALAGLVDAVPTSPPIYLDQIALQAATVGGPGRDAEAGGRMEDEYYDDMGMGGMPGYGATEGGGAQAFGFNASMDEQYQEDLLMEAFPDRLQNAKVYPQSVSLFSDVKVGPARFDIVSEGEETDDAADFIGDEESMIGVRRQRRELVVPIEAVLRSKDDIAEDIDKQGENTDNPGEEAMNIPDRR